jgi:hypothetical protein
MEVDLVARESVGALKVGCELMAQLRPGGDGPLGQVHEPRPSYTDQDHREIVGHDGLIPSSSDDQVGVNLQELGGVDTPVVLLRQVGLELAQLDHHAEVQGSSMHPPPPRQGCRGASSLPHRGGVHRTKVPIEVVTLAATPLPLVLDGEQRLSSSACKSAVVRLAARIADDTHGHVGERVCC